MKSRRSRLLILLFLVIGLLTACRPLVGTDWSLTSLNGHELIPETAITATFNGREIAGHAGCNFYSAIVDINDGTLVFKDRDAAVYDLLCYDPKGIMDQEQEYITALMSVTTYSLSNRQLEMKNDDGDVVLIFTKGLPKGFPG